MYPTFANSVFLLSAMLQLITDVNMAVAVEAIQAIGNLARGLRTHFAGSSRSLLPVLLVSAFTFQNMPLVFANYVVSGL